MDKIMEHTISEKSSGHLNLVEEAMKLRSLRLGLDRFAFDSFRTRTY